MAEEKKPAAKKTAAKKTVAKKTAAKKTAAKTTTSSEKAAKAPAKAAAPKKADKPKPEKTVRVTLLKSVIGTKASHRATVRGLGLRRIRHSVELEDTPAVRGMINKVSYLLRVEA